MSKKKLRKTAKNLKSVSGLKKKIAVYLAKTSIMGEIDIQHVLVYGHRGFLAMSEEQLTNRFDKRMEELEANLQNLRDRRQKSLQEGMKAYDLKYYYDDKIKAAEAVIIEAQTIIDEIFEKVALV